MINKYGLFILLTICFGNCWSQITFSSLQFGDPAGNNRGSAAVFDDALNIWFAGTARNFENNTDDIALTKLDKNGNIKFAYLYGDGHNEFVNNMVFFDNTYLIVCGDQTDTLTGNTNGFIMKTDTAGNLIWFKSYGNGISNEDFYGLTLLQNGDIAVTGFVTGAIGSGNDVLTVIYNQDGDFIQEIVFGDNTNEYGMSLIELPSGDLIISGDKEISATVYNPFYARVTREENIVFNQAFGIDENSGCKSMLLNNNGNLVFSGEVAGVIDPQFDLLIAEADTLGNILFINSTPGLGIEAGYDIAIASDSTYYVTGFGYNPLATENDMVFFLIDAAGEILQRKFFENGGADLGYDIKRIDDTHFLAAGFSTQFGTLMFTLVYDMFETGDIVKNTISNNNVQIFPQPAANILNLTSNENIQSIRIQSLAGNFLLGQDGMNSKNVQLNIDLPLSVYMITIVTTDNMYTKKIIAGQ